MVEAGMSEPVLYWVLVLIRITLYTTMTLCISWRTATSNIDWGHLGLQERIGVVMDSYTNWAIVMIVFLDKTAGRVAKGKPMIDTNGDTAFVKKEDAATAAPEKKL
jgi:hypothetical protein